jgi:hypothetical protein
MTGQHEDTNGWVEWKNYVLEGLKSNNTKMDELLDKVNRVEIELSAIKIKSSIFSTIGGFFGGVVTVIGSFFFGGGSRK